MKLIQRFKEEYICDIVFHDQMLLLNIVIWADVLVKWV